MVSSVLTHKFYMISSLKTTRFVVQFSSHKNAALKSLTKLLLIASALRVSSVCTLIHNKKIANQRARMRSVIVKTCMDCLED